MILYRAENVQLPNFQNVERTVSDYDDQEPNNVRF
jgi:hypothetical protein